MKIKVNENQESLQPRVASVKFHVTFQIILFGLVEINGEATSFIRRHIPRLHDQRAYRARVSPVKCIILQSETHDFQNEKA